MFVIVLFYVISGAAVCGVYFGEKYQNVLVMEGNTQNISQHILLK